MILYVPYRHTVYNSLPVLLEEITNYGGYKLNLNKTKAVGVGGPLEKNV